ncbi:hypothetical protein ACQEVB_10425 [Pseudonocardia sp. CA-107938]|uniref:hypothetical protein n=1 Tax=Pseudonocardia sp. CA-107938 TaxID=3240021 RepID=UPI003D92528D
MAVAALISWVLTAGGGLFMLGTWIAKGGVREPRSTHLPPAVIFGHFGLAAAGLVLWIVHLVAGGATLAWIAFVLLLPVAALGFVMLLRWIPTYRGAAVTAGGGGTAASAPPERSFPVAVVGAHGVLAVVTLVLVLLSALAAA